MKPMPLARLLITIATANLLLIAAGAGLAYLAATYPFAPGDGLFPLQRTAEQLRLRVSAEGETRARWALQLAVPTPRRSRRRRCTDHR